MLQRCSRSVSKPSCQLQCSTSKGGVPVGRWVKCGVFSSAQDLSSKSSVTYINRPVRQDEHVEAPGSLVVRGDVDADASIEAAGDVMVWGRLSGHVHAGCTGDRSAVITALELRGAQLVIARSTSLGAARITVPGPHTASVLEVGRALSINLTPLGPSHPPLNCIGLTSSFRRFLAWYPAAATALLTGCYALLAGLALLVAPKAVLGLLCDARAVPSAWIRVGGVLFATFGAQYLGTAIADYRQVHAASTSSSGCPDMPFRPASPQPVGATAAAAAGAARGAAVEHQQQPAPAAAGATLQQQQPATAVTPAAAAAFASATAGALLHDSSVLVDSGRLSSSRSGGGGGASVSGSSSRSGGGGGASVSAGGSSSRPGMRSVAAGQLTPEQIEQLRQSHKQWHKATAAAAAAAGSSTAASTSRTKDGSSSSSSSMGGVPGPQGVGMSSMQSSHWDLQPQQPQQQQQQQPPTWAFCSAGFYEASVWARLGLAAAFCALVAFVRAPPGLLVLALINLFGALSMWGALRRQWLMHVMGDMPAAAGAYASS